MLTRHQSSDHFVEVSTKGVQLGVYSFGDRHRDPLTGEQVSVADKLAQTLERIKLADELGLGFYGLGEHHLPDFSISSTRTWDRSHRR